MDLRAYISLRQRSIDLRRNLWSVDIEQCVMHGLHSNTILVRVYQAFISSNPSSASIPKLFTDLE